MLGMKAGLGGALALGLALLLPGLAKADPVPICAPQLGKNGCGAVYGSQIGTGGTLVSSKVVKALPGVLLGFSVGVVGATASTDYWVEVFDLAAAPGTTSVPSHVYLVTTDSSGNGGLAVAWQPGTYENYVNGIVVGLSSSCCGTFTAVAKAFVSGNVN